MVGENHTELEIARDGDLLVTRWRSSKNTSRHILTLRRPPAVHLPEHSPLPLEKPLLMSRWEGEAWPGPQLPVRSQGGQWGHLLLRSSIRP